MGKSKGSAVVPADWTIMLYIAADTTLANFAVESLKQLNESASRPAGKDDKANVVVAAQFSIDAPGGQESQRYVFRNGGKKGLKANTRKPLDARNEPMLSEREALERFLEWGRTEPELQSDRYALILWSHGPELFLQPPLGGNANDAASLYLTPVDLRDALVKFNKPRTKNPTLEIVGFDACSMSMFELAYEIKDLAKLMIASQEEVPDASFPYYDLVTLFRQQGKALGWLLDTLDSETGVSGPKSASLKGVKSDALVKSFQSEHPSLLNGVRDYLDAYQDYVVGKPTGMHPVTLAVLNLSESDGLKDAVRHLACALLKAKNYPELPHRLIQARKNSQDYAGGLYVDLHDFCAKLSEQLDKAAELDKAPARWKGIKEACLEVQRLLKPPPVPPITTPAPHDLPPVSLDSPSASPTPAPTPFILINGAVTQAGEPLLNQYNTTSNHGISIYLPYLTDQQFDDEVNRPLVKGGRGTNGGKSIPINLNGAAGDYLMSALQSLILTTESYYGDLKLAADTTWYSFITDQWTKAIKETDPNPDFRYSARQIGINLHRKPINVAKACK